MSPIDHDGGSTVTTMPLSPSLRESVRRAALAEVVPGQPVSTWHKDAWALTGLTVGTTLLALAGAKATDVLAHDFALSRLPGLFLLLAAQGLGVWAAVKPHSRKLVFAAIAAALGAAIALVVGRAEMSFAGGVPDWVCPASHVAVELVPLGAAIVYLGRAAWKPTRALAAGIGIGTIGTLAGELVCERGWVHAAIYHLGGWAVVAGLCIVIARARMPRSFAP